MKDAQSFVKISLRIGEIRRFLSFYAKIGYNS